MPLPAMPSPIDRLPTADELRDLAGGAGFARGERYAKSGAVESLARDADRIVAQVAGGSLYDVELRLDDDGHVVSECSCPAASGGAFCKHAVAVALVAASGVTPPPPPRPRNPDPTLADVRAR